MVPSSTVPVGMWTPDEDWGASAAARFQFAVTDSDICAVLGWRAGANSSMCRCPVVFLVITLKVLCALFLVLNRSRGSCQSHTPLQRLCVTSLWNVPSLLSSECLAAEAGLNLWADPFFFIYFSPLWFDLTKHLAQGRGLAQPSARNIVFPVFVFSSYRSLCEEREEVNVLCCSCITLSSEICSRMEKKCKQA